MTLSIIIVNYNVKYFLEQCLKSVEASTKKIKIEVFIVDNNSQDGSVEIVKKKFPKYNLIENKKNIGFSKANNQAIKKAKGKYILLLNPDTILEEDTIIKCINFIEKTKKIGSLGVKMIDGNGNFLPESKRSFPKPMVSFYKIFGLSDLFPQSKTFGKYHLSFLNENEIHEVDVLSGAFFMTKKSILKKIGLLDEKFFMYGEDIDLSYRIKLAGYKNYYFPKTKIIHYKGESTKKASMNYVFLFYKAMSIFYNKHFKGNYTFVFHFLIHIAIYIRAGISLIKRFLEDTAFTLIDIILIYFGINFLKNIWEKFSINIIGEQKILPNDFMKITVPICIIIWVFFIYKNKGYANHVKIKKVLQSTTLASILILIIYGLLPEEARSSRILILVSSFWTIISLTSYRKILAFLGMSNFKTKIKKIAIIGDQKQFQKVKDLIEKTIQDNIYIKHIDFLKINSKKDLEKLNEIILKSITIESINEVIFCSKNISFNHILNEISFLNKYNLKIKIAPETGGFIIGSDSKNTQGELYIINDKKINN